MSEQSNILSEIKLKVTNAELDIEFNTLFNLIAYSQSRNDIDESVQLIVACMAIMADKIKKLEKERDNK